MAIEAHPTPWREILLVCRKCGKKLDGEGFGPDRRQSLPRALRTRLREAGHRRDVRVVETRCLGLCPKRAVTVLRAGRPGQALAVPPGTGAGVVLSQLDLA